MHAELWLCLFLFVFCNWYVLRTEAPTNCLLGWFVIKHELNAASLPVHLQGSHNNVSLSVMIAVVHSVNLSSFDH